jgi:hypothetical protein
MGFFSKLRGFFSGRGAGETPKASGGFFSRERREERRREREYKRSQRRMEKWERKEQKQREREYKRSQRRMEKWERKEQKQREKEKARRAEEERRQKEADRKQRQQVYNKAYNTFSDRYGMSESEYRGLIDVWGGVTQDMKDIFGDSKKGDGSLVYAYKELSPQHRQNFPAILQSVMNDIEGQGYNQEQAINKLYDTIDYLNAGGVL